MADNGRTRRQRGAKKEAQAAACARLKQLKGSKNKYEVHEEAPVYDMVDEAEYADIVAKRQKEEWIEDDDIGDYRDDGREIFDDDIEENLKDGDIYANERKSKKKMPLKRKSGAVADDDFVNEEDEQPVKKNISITKMFKKIEKNNELRKKRKVAEPSVNDDELLDNILTDMNNDVDLSVPSHSISSNGFTNLRALKLKKKQLHTLKVANPFLSVEATRELYQPRRGLPGGLKKKVAAIEDEYDDLLSEMSTQKMPLTSGSGTTTGSSGYDTGADLFDDDFDESCLDNITAVPTTKAKPDTKYDTNWDHSGANSDMNTTFAISIPDELSNELELFTEGAKKDKYLKFYWFDAHENHFATPGVVYIFGKVHMKNLDTYVSCCVVAKNVERRMYLLPRDTFKSDPQTKVTVTDVYDEFNSMTKKLKIKSFRSRPVNKKYAFDKSDVPTEAEYLEVLIPATANIPEDLQGDSFSCVFGYNQSVLERMIVDLKLRGPSWLKVKNPIFSTSKVSWCKVELNIERLNQLSFDEEDNTPAPPLVLMSITTRTIVNPQSRHNELVGISVLIDREFNIDKGSSNNKKAKFDTHFCAITKPSPSTGVIFPYDLQLNKIDKQYSKTKLEVKSSERELLNFFMAKFGQIDADILVGHDIHAFDLEVLLSRMAVFKVGSWSKLGRLRRSGLPSLKKRDKAMATAGRIVADLKISARELIKAKSYDLTELSLQVLKQKRQEIEREGISGFYQSAQRLFDLVSLTMMDNNLILNIVLELSVLPLALQITKVAGNLFSRTLLGGRSERNEFLLLHAFNDKNYIVPDKVYSKKHQSLEIQELEEQFGGNSEVVAAKGPQRKKAAYAGGLVLDPKVGFYSDYVLIMDFNSLYPSIMREFNICFTTVQFGSLVEASKEATEPDDGEDKLPPLPEKGLEQGILPTQITKLVESRREVKKLLKNDKLSADLRSQYDIKQMALKLTANSMYGCLGFGNSRFYAKPLAALITAQGRKILMDTKNLVERMGYEVIYGDTDSIMINTKSGDFDEAFGTSTKVKVAVNQLYKHLEIECDGFLKSMLLLKKKKYAALVATVDKKDSRKVNYTKELKGLDIVRRDWSLIAKSVGEKVVDQILSVSKTPDQILDSIHELLRTTADDIENGRTSRKEFQITKQLTKNPEDYPDKKNLSHVTVALRYNETNKSGKKLRGGDVVPYIICLKASNPANFNGLPATQRAFHFDEVNADPEELLVDTKYYLSQQIHPVVSRLCEPIHGTDASVIAEMLGLSSDQVPSTVKAEDPAEAILGWGEAKFDICKSLLVKCPSPECGKSLDLRKLFIEAAADGTSQTPSSKFRKITFSLAACSHCGFDFKDKWWYVDRKRFKNLAAQVRAACRFLVTEYYAGWMTCEDPICNFKTRLATGNMTKRGPLCTECKSSAMRLDFSEAQLFLQLSFWESIVDIKAGAARTCDDKYREHIEAMAYDYENVYKVLLKTVREFTNSMAYKKVDKSYLFRGQVFDCMRQKNG